LFVRADGPPEGLPELPPVFDVLNKGAGSPPSLPLHLRAKFQYFNVGNTPIRVMQGGSAFEMRKWPLPDEPFPLPMYDWFGYPIAKGHPHGGKTPYLHIPTAEEWALLRNRSHCLVYYGTVRYRDI